MARSSSNVDAGHRVVPRPRRGELLVSEVFGPTIQGEGPTTGAIATFVRLGGCNLTCAWCDTSYTWDGFRHDLTRELKTMSTVDVARQALSLRAPLIILTGGEPALQATEGARLARLLNEAGAAVELETSGSVPLGPLAEEVRLVVASPKLTSSGVPERTRLRWDILAGISALPHAVLKFVVRSPHELAEADHVVARLGIESRRVWVMPEGTDADVVLHRMRALAGPVIERGWSLSGRLHVLLWDDERGR